MSPMTPMPRSRADQGIGRGAPISSCLLARQDGTTGTRASKLHEAGRLELATTALRIEQGAHRLSDGLGLNRPLAVVRVPSLEQFDDLTAVRVIRLDCFDSFDRIATAQRQEWVAAPFGPLLEAAEQATGHEIDRVLPPPAPDRQGWPQSRQRLNNHRESRRQVIARPAEKPHPLAVPAGNDLGSQRPPEGGRGALWEGRGE